MLVMMLSTVTLLSSCGDDDEDDPTPIPTPNPEVSIVGLWQAEYDENEYFVMCFKENGKGYGCEKGKEDKARSQFSYQLKGDKIYFYGDDTIWENVVVEYELSKDGKQLTIYGVDDNDLSVLHFKRQ